MDEYIGKNSALNIVKGNWLFMNSADDAIQTSIEMIRRLPAADVRPVVRGKWRLYSPLTDTFECDKCGYQVIDESFRTNFCPNCGARMEES